MIYLHPVLQKILPSRQRHFDYFMKLQGESFRALEGRRTLRIVLNNEHYFIKQHLGIGWKEILKNLFQLKQPICGAKNEWMAIQRLQALSVSTPTIMAYGRRGWNPARQQSFLLMKALAPTISLEDFCRTWKKQPPAFSLKLALIRKVAEIARTLHENGMNHRDFYLCHFLLPSDRDPDPARLTLYLIDLHRAGLHRRLRRRWIIKDLAGLYFSSKDINLTRHDLWRFMKAYHHQDLRAIMETKISLWRKVKIRGEKLYEAHALSNRA